MPPHDRKVREFVNTLNWPRAPADSLWPADLTALLWRHKHPRWCSVSVLSTRWGNNPRRLAGLPEMGTVIFEGWATRAESAKVPCNQIPYMAHESEWRDDWQRFEKGSMPGWRGAFARMASEGHLRPSHELSYLIGQDTFALCPEHLHVP